jgi:drug/metabolite transporter (DMT)-like permease
MSLPPAARPITGYVLVGTAAAMFAVNGSVSKIVLDAGLSAERLTEIRAAGALLVLLVVCVVRRTPLRVERRDLPLIAFYGVVGFAMVQWLYLITIGRLPVGIGLLFEFTAPVLMAAYARLVQKRPVRGRFWAALVLSLSGLTLVAEAWSDARLDAIGVGAGLLCAIALAVFYLVGEHRTAHHDPYAVIFWGFLFATLFWTVLRPWWSYPAGLLDDPVDTRIGTVELPIWALIAWIVVLGTAVPFLFSMKALRHLPATTIGVTAMAEPVLAGAVAWVWLDQRLAAWQVAGSVVVLVGIGLAQTARIESLASASGTPSAIGDGGDERPADRSSPAGTPIGATEAFPP